MSKLLLLSLLIAWGPQETPGIPPGVVPGLSPGGANLAASQIDYVAMGKRLQTQLRSPQKSVRLQAIRTYSRNLGLYQAAEVRPFALLEDPDPEIRRVALSVTRQMGRWPSDIRALLRRYLGSRHAEAQIFSLEHLSLIGKLTPSDEAKIKELLRSSKPDVRVAVLRDAPLSKPLVQQRLRDPDASVRQQAARTLSGFTAPNLPEIVKRATSIKAGERLSAARALERMAKHEATSSPAIIQALLPLTRDRNAEIRNEAVMTLSSLNAENAEVAQAMAALLRDVNSKVRSVAANYFLTHQGDFAFAIPPLLALAVQPIKSTVTMDPSDDTEGLLAARDARGWAFAVLGRIGADNAHVRETLTGLLKETAQDGFALNALTQISEKHPELVEPLLHNLASAGMPERQLASLMTAQRNNTEALDLLTRFWDAQPADFRRETIAALASEPQFTTDIVRATGSPVPDVVERKPTLARNWVKALLNDKDPQVRLSAARIMSSVLTGGDDVLNLLLTLRDDPDAQVQDNLVSLMQNTLSGLLEMVLRPEQTPAQSKATIAMANAFVDKVDSLPQAEKAKLKGVDELVARTRKQIREINEVLARKPLSNGQAVP